LEMVDWAERMGFQSVNLSEHHGDPAGYLPAPLTLAAAVLARTEHIAVTVGAALVPLHDPVRIAEQLAVLDLIGPGRLSVIVGAGRPAGYREGCEGVGCEGVVEGLGDEPMRRGFVMVSEDPESAWGRIAPLALYDAESYASWRDDAVVWSLVVPDLSSADVVR